MNSQWRALVQQELGAQGAEAVPAGDAPAPAGASRHAGARPQTDSHFALRVRPRARFEPRTLADLGAPPLDAESLALSAQEPRLVPDPATGLPSDSIPAAAHPSTSRQHSTPSAAPLSGIIQYGPNPGTDQAPRPSPESSSRGRPDLNHASGIAGALGFLPPSPFERTSALDSGDPVRGVVSSADTTQQTPSDARRAMLSAEALSRSTSSPGVDAPTGLRVRQRLADGSGGVAGIPGIPGVLAAGLHGAPGELPESLERSRDPHTLRPVQVTIGAIELRIEGPAREPAPRGSRPSPKARSATRSLHEYLNGPGHGEGNGPS